jgi:hypothetical protein
MTPGRGGLNLDLPDQWWPQALAHGVLGYYLIVRVIAQEFDLSPQATQEAFSRASTVTRQLSDEQTRGLGSGDPCACGGGRAFGECHGS